MNIDLLVIILFIIGCGAAYKAFTAKDAQQKRLYGFIALFLGGVLFVLRNYVSK
jgi:Na+/H+ antiporter NhaC